MEVYKVSKTLKGKFRTILAKFLSFYCIYRLITVKNFEIFIQCSH